MNRLNFSELLDTLSQVADELHNTSAPEWEEPEPADDFIMLEFSNVFEDR